MATVYNYYINVADFETETTQIAGETVEEAEKYAVMAGFEITAPTVKAEIQSTGQMVDLVTGEIEPVKTIKSVYEFGDYVAWCDKMGFAPN